MEDRIISSSGDSLRLYSGKLGILASRGMLALNCLLPAPACSYSRASAGAPSFAGDSNPEPVTYEATALPIGASEAWGTCCTRASPSRFSHAAPCVSTRGSPLVRWPSRVRTCDIRINSAALCQLSYEPRCPPYSMRGCSGVPVRRSPPALLGGLCSPPAPEGVGAAGNNASGF